MTLSRNLRGSLKNLHWKDQHVFAQDYQLCAGKLKATYYQSETWLAGQEVLKGKKADRSNFDEEGVQEKGEQIKMWLTHSILMRRIYI